MSRNKSPALHLQDLRAKIAALQCEHHELLDQKRSRSEAAAYLRNLVDGWAQEGLASIVSELQKLTHGNPSQPLNVKAVAPIIPGGHVTHFNVNLAPLLVALVGADKVTDVFAAALEQLPAGLSQADQTARMTEIYIELDRLESEEETLIYASGGAFERRSDARAEIVLGMFTATQTERDATASP